MLKGDQFRKMALSPWRMKLYMLRSLPMAFLARLKVISLDEQSAVVSLPDQYLNKNPFRSIYFAALSMAAELSTGLLALAAVKDVDVPMSLLVLDLKASFEKKAIGTIIFTCDDGVLIKQAVELAMKSKEGQTITAESIGKNEQGEDVCNFQFTWTFKSKH